MNYTSKYLFVSIFTLYFIFIDKNIRLCKSISGRFLLIIHHMLASFGLFSGILFGLYHLNILIIVLTILSWVILKRCVVSILNDILCGGNAYEHLTIGKLIRDYVYKKTNVKIHWSYEIIPLILIIFYNAYMIYNNNKMSQKLK